MEKKTWLVHLMPLKVEATSEREAEAKAQELIRNRKGLEVIEIEEEEDLYLIPEDIEEITTEEENENY